ncbi:MAG TPA: glutaminyl-peptide cyclotransferase [Thermoanaerobaculia bacterium]|nr:glutaminyl-peptide cyclotransferase [Thermoanaerobaculia bacterium]
MGRLSATPRRKPLLGAVLVLAAVLLLWRTGGVILRPGRGWGGGRPASVRAGSAAPASPGAESAEGRAGGAIAAAGGPATGLAAGPLAPASSQPSARRLRVKVLSVRPHDPTAYTQGLVWFRGLLYESAGLYDSSSLREVDAATGEVRRRLQVPPGFFAEGLAQVDDRLVQLTWKEGVAFVYGIKSFERVGEFHYQGEGWGLCNDGRRLVMSDGSDRLTFRDPKSFARLGEVRVRLDGRPLDRLNELECVGGSVYANVWTTEDIVRIDPASGEVSELIDASGLLGQSEKDEGAEVLNGIAYDPESRTFLITGKLWPKLFEVQFVPKGS